MVFHYCVCPKPQHTSTHLNTPQHSFPDNPPRTKEYYLLRSMFVAQFPAPSAERSVPKGLSIACSTEEAVKWDAAWANTHEISGRAMAGVHEAGTGFGSGTNLANGVAH